MVARLRAAVPVSAVVVFGSRATGEHTQHSDYDLAVVSPAFAAEPRMFRRAAVLLAALGDVRGIDPVGLAPEELESLDGLLVLDVVADGTPLLDDGCLARARARLVELQRSGSLERLRGGWRTPPTRDE
ncbi:MAG: nucleotidyltransferase domain-containing protein [Deltaproteobacteria bacterium]|nr:nucleotidyltransferase domain-containing protein [Deltaproteobacteria bacterium]